jgi:hypothetical protein
MTTAVKRGVAYLRNEKIYLHPYARTIKVIWTAREPIVVTSEKDESLGEKVLQTLRAGPIIAVVPILTIGLIRCSPNQEAFADQK